MEKEAARSGDQTRIAGTGVTAPIAKNLQTNKKKSSSGSGNLRMTTRQQHQHTKMNRRKHRSTLPPTTMEILDPGRRCNKPTAHMTPGNQIGVHMKGMLTGKKRLTMADRLRPTEANTATATGKASLGRAQQRRISLSTQLLGTDTTSARNHIGSSLRVGIIISGRY